MALSKIQSEGINLADTFAFTGTVTGAGKILQVVTHVETGFTTFTNPGTARTDLLLLASNAADSTSHVSASITPSATNSKILIQVCVFYESSNVSAHEYLWDIYRDSTKLGSPKVGSRGGGISASSMGFYHTDAASTPDTRYYQFVDSPSSTSAITYAAAYNFSGTSGSVYLNRTANDTDSAPHERGVSSIVLQEIAG